MVFYRNTADENCFGTVHDPIIQHSTMCIKRCVLTPTSLTVCLAHNWPLVVTQICPHHVAPLHSQAFVLRGQVQFCVVLKERGWRGNNISVRIFQKSIARVSRAGQGIRVPDVKPPVRAVSLCEKKLLSLVISLFS